MMIKELRQKSGMTQKRFAEYFGVSKRAIETWESDSPTAKRTCPKYLLDLMEYKLRNEKIIDAPKPETVMTFEEMLGDDTEAT